MLSRKLFKKVLLDPAQTGANELNIISGYATAAMAIHHLNALKNMTRMEVKVNLIIGMSVKDGLSKSNHFGFKRTVGTHKNFTCRYHVSPPAVHSKVYTWSKNGKPFKAFVGSANYTQTAFYEKQGECLAEADPALSLKYFNRFLNSALFCNHPLIAIKIPIYPDAVFARLKHPAKGKRPAIKKGKNKPIIADVPHVRISLLDKKGRLPKRSGLNWGQRPEEKRNPDQAYIHLPANIYKTDFFPALGLDFIVHTDDNKILTCHRAQQNGKAIHTPDNSLFGRYFKKRLGLAKGAMVKKANLLRYGRTTIDFYKIEDETYYMDFSKPS
ncbi:MAG: restriction endonuclease PLD domain-containing protein [Candidatus Omnitrophota bacterium]